MFKGEGSMVNMKNLVKQATWRIYKTRYFDNVRTRIGHTKFFHLKGKTKRTNCDLSILLFARENVVNYISDLAYSEKPQIKSMGNATYNNIPSIIAGLKPDIVFADVHEVFSKFFSKTFLILPYVTSTLDISAPWETIYARMKRVRKRNIQEIHGLSYDYEITRMRDKFHLFYQEMYLPFILKRPAKLSGFTPIDPASEMFSRGGLILVKSKNRNVAGILYHFVNETLHCALMAYDDGLAGQAALYFLIKWAKEKGYKEIHYGTTPPFMNDGLYLYKRSWGMKVNNNPKRMLAIRFNNFERAVQDFLLDNPFIFRHSTSLIGLILLNTNNVNPSILYRKYYTRGLNKLLTLYPERDTRTRKMLNAGDSHVSVLEPVNSLIKLVYYKNFNMRLIDFSEEEFYS